MIYDCSGGNYSNSRFNVSFTQLQHFISTVSTLKKVAGTLKDKNP